MHMDCMVASLPRHATPPKKVPFIDTQRRSIPVSKPEGVGTSDSLGLLVVLERVKRRGDKP